MDATEAETSTTNLPIPIDLYEWIKDQAKLKGTLLRREMIEVMRDGRKYREKRK